MTEIITTQPITRRRFLTTSATTVGTVLGAGVLLEACGGQTASSTATTEVLLISPGDAPTGWSSVLSAVNKKLATDKGLSLKIQWVGWNNYANSTLLKYTAGEHFDATLDAPWMHITQLIADKAILPLDTYISSGKYTNLNATISQQMWTNNKFQGKVYGIPLGNIAGALLGMMTRKDLVDKYKLSDIKTYDDFERFLYTVKAHESGVTPFGLDKGYANNANQLFNRTYWEQQPQSAFPNSTPFYITQDATSPRVVPWWEQPGLADFLKTVRKYYQDGILNHDVLNVDKNEIYSLYGQGKFAAAQAGTDGLATSEYSAVLKNVSGSALELILPFSQTNPKPLSDFAVYNFLVVNKNSSHPEAVLALADWLSMKDNHDLLEYGIKGKNWKEVGSDTYTTLDQYAFPGYVVSWRPTLERLPSNSLPSDKHWYQFATDPNNFTRAVTAGFQFDPTPVKTQVSQLAAALSQYLLPLNIGAVDPTSGLSQLQHAFEQAGYTQVLGEAQKQVDAFMKQK